MKIALKTTLLFAMICANGYACAQEIIKPKVKAVISFAITKGGNDAIKTVTYTDGHQQTIKPGGKIDIKAGAEYRFVDLPAAVQLTGGWHYDSTNASNGELKISRVPIEMIGYGWLSKTWRAGVGLRYVTAAKIEGKGVLSYVGKQDINDSIGNVFEIEYMLLKQGSVGIRFVREKYEVKSWGEKFDASHIGLRMTAFF